MGSYLYYTVKQDKSFVGFYYCSRCKKLNAFEHFVHTQYSYKDKGFTQKAQQQVHDEGNAELRREAARNWDKIYREDKAGIYRTAAYTCRCEHCGHAEPWASMQYRKQKIISNIGAFIVGLVCFAIFAVIASSISSTSNNEVPVGAMVGAACGLLLGAGLWLWGSLSKRAKQNLLEQQIAQLDPIHRPHICWKPDTLEQIYQDMLKADPLADKKTE